MRRFLFACIATLASITPAAAHHPTIHYHLPTYRVWWYYSYHAPRPTRPPVRVVVVIKPSKPPVPRDPERLYSPRQLERWAEQNGYETITPDDD